MSAKREQAPGWYWVQDMRGAARPAWYDGGVYRNSPTDREDLCWHWPSFRLLGRCPEPTISAAQQEGGA